MTSSSPLYDIYHATYVFIITVLDERLKQLVMKQFQVIGLRAQPASIINIRSANDAHRVIAKYERLNYEVITERIDSLITVTDLPRWCELRYVYSEPTTLNSDDRARIIRNGCITIKQH